MKLKANNLIASFKIIKNNIFIQPITPADKIYINFKIMKQDNDNR